MGKLKQFYKLVDKFFEDIGINCRFLIIISVICLIVISISIFDTSLDATGNLVTIRTIFSAIVGFILEKTTSLCEPDPKAVKSKTTIIGSFALIATVIVALSYFLDMNVNNPSLVLIKNLLFSAVGFLTSSATNLRNK